MSSSMPSSDVRCTLCGGSDFIYICRKCSPNVYAENVQLRSRIAAMEKCIEARDAALKIAAPHLGVCGCPDCIKLRDAIRRADEEAGR